MNEAAVGVSCAGRSSGTPSTGIEASRAAPSEEVLLARAYLSRVSEPASLAVWAFVERVGPVEAAEAIGSAIAPPDVLAATQARREDADAAADLAAARRRDVRLIAPESPDWPHFGLAALHNAAQRLMFRRGDGPRSGSQSGDPIPPLALWIRGPLDPAPLGVRSAGIVGSRAATAYGEHVATEFGYGLAQAGVTVISGGAYGIDACAHRGALTAEGDTVLVSAGGLDRPYPPGNVALFERVAASGLLMSESPPGCFPQRHRFLTRNRLIAALSTGTVIVEAAARSGARNTAGHCITLQRPLMAVPGPITSPMSVGCHDLIRREPDPAILVSSVAEVLGVVGGIGEALAAGPGAAGPPGAGGVAPGDVRVELDALDPVARRVFEGLAPRRFAPPDEIGARSGVTVLEVIRALPTLELAGLVEAGPGGHRLAARLRRR